MRTDVCLSVCREESSDLRLLLLSLGLLCVLQAVLNVTLRLALIEPTCTGSYTTALL